MRRKKTNGLPKKQQFSDVTLKEAVLAIGQERIHPWSLNVPPRSPSVVLEENLRRLQSFDLQLSEAAKMLLVDVICAEIVPQYSGLKVWKSAILEGDGVRGYADYLVTPQRAYVDTPLLCVVEAKRNDFDSARPQCLMEMHTCAANNSKAGLLLDVYGIITSGQGWIFLKLAQTKEISES